MVKISVVVPVYNTASTLPRCLDSVLGQTFTDFEIIIVNDGSTDESHAVIASYAATHPEIVVVTQENQGLGAARNAGIRAARGTYIACVDSDDLIDSTMLEKMLRAVEAHEADVAICQADNVLYSDGERIKSLGIYTIPGKAETINGKEALTLQINYIVPILFNSVCFKLVRKSLFFDHGVWFPEQFRYAEDTPTSVGIFLYADTVALVRETLYDYVRENESLTSSYSLKKAHDIYLDVVDICSYIQKVDPSISVDNFVLGMLFSMEKQIIWSETKDKEFKDYLMMIGANLRTIHTPQLHSLNIPFIQKLKILCAYHGYTPMVCKMISLLKWIPFVRYML